VEITVWGLRDAARSYFRRTVEWHDGSARFLRPKDAEAEYVVEIVQGTNYSAYPLRTRQRRSKIVMSAHGAAAVEARE